MTNSVNLIQFQCELNYLKALKAQSSAVKHTANTVVGQSQS